MINTRRNEILDRRGKQVTAAEFARAHQQHQRAGGGEARQRFAITLRGA